MAQQTYEPLINPEGNVFCANYDHLNKYQRLQGQRPLYTEESVDSFWKKELEHILMCKDKSYAPEILDIDQTNKRLFFKWYGKSCNEIIFGGNNLDDICPDWRQQLLDIMIDLYQNNVYKLTMYSHCHMIDNNGQMKTFDWYGCISKDNPIIEAKLIESIVHGTALHRIKEVQTQDGNYDLSKMFKRSLGKYVTWGNQGLEYIYRKMFDEEPDRA